MMELKEGMYVRTKWGIAKYIHKLVTKTTIYYVIDKRIVYDNSEDWEDVLSSNEIIKASNNIIDLIEVGDYVNGSKVVNINYDLNYDEDVIESITIFDYSIEANDILHTEDIKSIVTKEQFESISYKVEE